MTITFVLGKDGLINKAKEATNAMNNAVANDQASLTNIVDTINGMVNGMGGSGDSNSEVTPPFPELPKLENTTGMQKENIKVKDKFGNVVTIPKGFEVVEQEGTTVPEGIVIQDSNENQFVWIPVGRVYKDVTKDNYSDIQLGRYTFDKKKGIPTLVQLAYTDSNPRNYEQLIKINSYYQECAIRANQDGIESETDGLNAIAKDLGGFVNSVKNNGGYYIARYEASYGSGSSVLDYKPLSKISTGTPRTNSKSELTQGMLWNCVIQIDAAKISRNMYKNDSSVGGESDLINSYAWDTAIFFIQEMGNENYANKTSINNLLSNTGTTGDKVCNIYDIASNCNEWTTEQSLYVLSGKVYTCVRRGGIYSDNSYHSAGRDYATAISGGNTRSFRVVLYVK